MKKKVYTCGLCIPSINNIKGHSYEIEQILVEKTLDPWVVKELVTGMKIPIVPHKYTKCYFSYWTDTWCSFDSFKIYPDHFKFYDGMHLEMIPPYPLYIMADIEKHGFIETIAILKEAELEDVKNYISTHQDIDQYSEELSKISEIGKEHFEILFDECIEEEIKIKNQRKSEKKAKKNVNH